MNNIEIVYVYHLKPHIRTKAPNPFLLITSASSRLVNAGYTCSDMLMDLNSIQIFRNIIFHAFVPPSPLSHSPSSKK
jgi:hypothetical protein